MPSSAEHRAKHQANRQLLDTGNNGSPLSTLDGCWAAIVAFYAALHCVDRLGAIATPQVHPTPPSAHGKRLRFLYANHRAIYADYNDLKTASEIARYGTLNQFNRAYPGTTVQTILIDQKLVAIENYVAGHFPAPAPAPAPVPPPTGSTGS
jgi:hypothetical protein